MAPETAKKELILTEVKLSKRMAMIYAAGFWLVFLLLVYYFEEFSTAMMELKSRRRNIWSSSPEFKMGFSYLLVAGSLLAALYYTYLVKTHKTEAPKPI